MLLLSPNQRAENKNTHVGYRKVLMRFKDGGRRSLKKKTNKIYHEYLENQNRYKKKKKKTD